MTDAGRSGSVAGWRVDLWAVGWGGLLVALFAAGGALVHAGVLASADRAVLDYVVATRPIGAVEPFNWVFRLGYAPLDALVATLIGAVILARTRSVRLALVPLVLFGVVAVQTAARLVVVRPGPELSFALPRALSSVGAVGGLDVADTAARGAFVQATGAGDQNDQGRGSYPSGHAARLGFFAVLGMLAAGRYLAGKVAVATAIALAVVALAVGYSTLFFGYHWPSDVAGGYALGAGAALAGWGVFWR